MRQNWMFAVLGTAVRISGCATKNYVRQDTQPIQAKLDQVAAQANKEGQELQQTRRDVDKNASAISTVDEKVSAAERRAGDAQNSANQASQKANQDSEEIAQLRGMIANIDEYKVFSQAAVLFALNRATLTDKDKQELDKAIGNTSTPKRFFIAVEGYADNTGTAEYNLAFSKRRADSVVQYLAVQRNVPFYQIRTIGLGEEQPADTGNNEEARAKNRSVAVKVCSADRSVSASRSSSSASR